jgi:hypothetical protein
MTKTTKKKKAASKPKKATATSILAECKAAVEKGLGKKRLSAAAEKNWRTSYKRMISKEIKRRPGEWPNDRRNVLRVAKKLGKVAAALSDGKIVLMWAAEAAAIAVRADVGCPVSGGGGGYCDPKKTPDEV